jgi:hypothetical protein
VVLGDGDWEFDEFVNKERELGSTSARLRLKGVGVEDGGVILEPKQIEPFLIPVGRW